MKAVAVTPGIPGSLRVTDMPEPRLDEVPGGRGVLVRVLRVGLDGTDREINAAKYGAAQAGFEFLVPRWPGWPGRLITHTVDGLDGYWQAFEWLAGADEAIKIVIEVGDLVAERG